MPDAPTPPWGEESNFDAARAWALIQSLRTELSDEKTKTTTERQGRQAAEQKLTDADPEGKLAAAEKRATDAERKLHVATVLGDFPALKGFEDLLTGDTPEAIKAQAERLAALGKPPAQEGEQKTGDESKTDDTPPAPGSQTPTPTPTPTLTPGHGGDNSAPFDPVAIAKASRR